MRSYSKLFLAQDWHAVDYRDVYPGGQLIALCGPRTKAQRRNAFNILTQGYNATDAVWQLRSTHDGSLIVTFSPPQLAFDVFQWQPWELRHNFDGRPRN